MAQKPKPVAVIHCCGHQKENSQITPGNNRADGEAEKTNKQTNSRDAQVETNTKKIQQVTWLQQTVNHLSLLYSTGGKLKTGFLVDSLGSHKVYKPLWQEVSIFS